MCINQIKERLASFAVAKRYMNLREERCANFKLETARLGGEIETLKVVVTKFKGDRDDLKGLV